jgi:FkbM family methyltransferase
MARFVSRIVLAYVRYCPIERGKWRLLRIANQFLVVRLGPNVLMRIAGMSNVEMAIARNGMFEGETVELFLKLLTPGMTVLDVGANVGIYTLLAAERVGPAGRVYAFEPTHHVAAKLRSNVRLNGFDNVDVNEMAVSDSCGEATLFYVEDDGENNILAPEPGYDTSAKIPTITLDEFMALKGIDKVDVIKMDIEGAELMALRGASRLLVGDQCPVIFLEVNPRTLAFGKSRAADLVEFLQQHGYQVGRIATYGVNTHDPWSNVVAYKPVHQDRWPFLQTSSFLPVMAT